MTNDIGLDLKVARRKAGLTQGDCAHLLGVHPSKISLMESGRVLPSVRDISMLALIYGKPFENLLAPVIESVRHKLPERLVTIPACPKRWLGRFNRQNTLNALSVRLDALNKREYDGA